ncbi:MAG TPA: sodium:solute symporter family protein [Candidatus Dormibacteraeota bacterium]|nr:sodium:solute symporter family protein [Candidatus Dormibacteraeota bacterium]
MHLTAIDWAVIVGFFAVNIAIGLWYARRGGRSVGEFFLSGRSVPWWLAGTSMVATTFAADTPLVVSGLVEKNGIAGNWLWWNMVMSGMLTVFFFAALWRRAGVLTDVELVEVRYAGRAATFLRGFRAAYLGLAFNTIVMGWVNLAMAKILLVTLHATKVEAVLACMLLTAIYVSVGGLWGVLVTDLLQFVVKMSMAIVLAVAAVSAVGGLGALRVKLAAVDLARHAVPGTADSVLSFVPDLHGVWMPVLTFLVYVGVQWWASSYPGAEPGGGGYIAQRIFCAQDERHSLLATLWFNIAHYALRPWPWILVALAALVLYPHGVVNPVTHKPDAELGYVQTMIDYLPPWLRGLMMAGFLSAYMSTIGSQLNLGASYVVNDLYRRFVVRGASERHYVGVSRAATLALMLLSAFVTLHMNSITGAWEFLLAFGAGAGLVFILRWYWWRINAWSEISALIASFAVSTIIEQFHLVDSSQPLGFAHLMLWTVGISTAIWLAVTLLTPPEPMEHLVAFYRRVRPGRAGWGPVAALAPDVDGGAARTPALLDWIAGCALIYCAIFGVGKILLGAPALGAALLLCAAACFAFILWNLGRRGYDVLGSAPAESVEGVAELAVGGVAE